MKTFMKLAVFALIMGVMLFGFDALAQTSTGTANIFTRTFTVLGNVFKNVRVIVYIIGAFGLIGIAVMAILSKMQFKWLAYLAIGLAIVAAADLVVKFATNAGKTDNDSTTAYTSQDIGSYLSESGSSN